MVLAKKARQKVLAIDYGTKRIGLAINYGFLAEPLKVIANQVDEKQPLLSQTAEQEINELCRELKIERIVLGISEQKMAEQSKKFGDLLHKKLSLPVDFVDETLSSQEAMQKMKEAKLKKKKQQGPIDHYAAAIILEEWLNSQVIL